MRLPRGGGWAGGLAAGFLGAVAVLMLAGAFSRHLLPGHELALLRAAAACLPWLAAAGLAASLGKRLARPFRPANLAFLVFFLGVLAAGLGPRLRPGLLPPDGDLAARMASPSLLSIPLFMLASELAVAAGLAERLLAAAARLAGGGRRGTEFEAVLGCFLLATVSGAGPAAADASLRRLLPAGGGSKPRREALAGAAAVASGLCVMIPSSVALTLYAAIAGVRANLVFTASFLPGLLAAALLALAALLQNRPSGAPDPVPDGGRTGRVFWEAKWALCLPALVLSSLFTGFFSAPEAAAFACAYSAAVGHWIYGRLGWGDLLSILRRLAEAASGIVILFGVVCLVMRILEIAGVQAGLAEAVFRLAGGRLGAVLVMDLLLLAAGCLLGLPGFTALTASLLLPLAAKCGLPLAQFGAVLAAGAALGLATPPRADALSAAARAAGVGRLAALAPGWPYLAAQLAVFLAASYFPSLSLWLPERFGWAIL